MRASFLLLASLSASLFAVACSGSSSSDVLAPAPATSSTVDKNDPSPSPSPSPPSSEPPESDDVPPSPPPKEPPPTAGPPASPAECDAFAAKFCAKSVTCDGLVSTLLGSDCADRVGNICKARLSAPGTGFTSAALTACGNAYGASTTCEDAFGAGQLTACNIKGALSLGAKCAFSDQCASGHCTGNEDNTCGTCAPAPAVATPTFAGLGEACDFGSSGPQCNSSLGLWCDSATKKCEEMALVAIGQTCGFVGNDLVMCGPGGSCKWGSGNTGTGTCVAQKAIGAACTAASGFEECAFGTTCLAGKCAYPTAAAICK